MNHLLNHTLAAIAAFVLALGSIGAIVTVPPAQSPGAAVLALPALA
ncbi:MAG: hypothetical protein HLUCCX21_00430 [Porphyrobacter sp. HL-46]|nr:MAG: hypothetical protein HLUCCX21_00430 [Porphyrobacter sp. HL-46]